MTAAGAPRTCAECREYHPLRAYNERGDRDNCNPRGTKWHLRLQPEREACRSVHAVKRDVDGPSQGALL